MERKEREIIEIALRALADFKREFGRDLTPSLLAELYVALKLDLAPATQGNQAGFDLIATDGKRFQVKQRDPATLNLDINSFDFDYLVLVNLADDYSLLGLWKMHVNEARKIFRHREKFRKYQATQKAFKDLAERIFVRENLE